MSFMSRFTSGSPVAVSPDLDLNAYVAAANALASVHANAMAELAAAPDFWAFEDLSFRMLRPYVVVDGVLQIPVKGILLNDFGFALGAWATGYDYIRAAVERGAADPEVDEIALMVDSGGGMVTGCQQTGEAIFRARSAKKVTAYVQDHAYSAAYWLASAATEVVVTETGGAGSIGVITYHIDASGAYEQWGIVKTYLSVPAGKADGREDKPLSDDARKQTEAHLAASYDVFVRTISRNRNLTAEAIRDTNAATYPALTAIELGLADRIGTHDDATSADSATTPEEDDDMAEAKAVHTQEALDAAVAAARAEEATKTEGAVKAAREEGWGGGASAERDRIGTILGSDAAKTRPAAAHQAAFVLALDAEKAATFLAAMPEEKPTATGAAAPKGLFDAAMQSEGSTGLSADVDPTAANEDAAVIAETLRLAGLAKH